MINLPDLPQQISVKKKLMPNKVGALFMKPGAAKTRPVVDMVNDVDGVDLVVWVAPLRTIRPLDPSIKSITEEIEKWGGFRCPNVIYIGIETIQSSDRQYLQLYNKIRHAWKPFIVIDESITIKNHDAKRTSRMLELSKMVEYKLILNGEPVTRDLLDIWAQIQFLDPRILNMSNAEFKNTFCRYTTITKTTAGYGRIYKKEFITGYENIDYLYSLIGEYIFECDLNLNVERLFEERFYTLSDEEKSEYTRLKLKYLDDEMLLMRNNNIFLELTMKMQHGYCCTENKFEVAKDWIGDNEARTIIFTKYIASADECRKRFPKATVLNYQSGSFSYNLQHLPYMIFFDKTFDWGRRKQAMARNFRTGSTENVKCLDLTGNVNLEELMKRNNAKKLDTSEYLKTISKKQLEEDL